MSVPIAEPPTRRAGVKVEVAREAAPILEAWAELEAGAPCSIYQTRAFLRPWIETLGPKAGMQPLFILARTPDGTPSALFCLGLVRRGPFKIAVFLGGKDSNLNFPLIAGGGAWTEATLRRLLRDAAGTLGSEAPDVFVLGNQPFDWNGTPNPLALLPHHESPSAAYGTMLPRDPEVLFAGKLSKETRKKLRKKEARLAALGPLTHRVATSDAERAQILGAFLEQKIGRFRKRGIRSEFDTPEMHAFIKAASVPDVAGIELHALSVGERIVATYGGAAHDGQWSGMFNSFDADKEVAKSSPGDLLLMRIMAKACADGLTRFDLGIGEARYKAALCGEAILLFDTLVPVSLRGRALAQYVTVRQQAKRIVKRSPRLMALVKRLRAR